MDLTVTGGAGLPSLNCQAAWMRASRQSNLRRLERSGTMSILNALAGVLRPRPTVHVTGAASSAADATYASISTGALAGGPPPAAGVLGTSAPLTAEEQEPSTQEKQLMLHLSNVSHGVNHFQNQMMTMLWPSIMAELGLGYTEVGVLSAIVSVLSSICQGAYGFLTPFFS